MVINNFARIFIEAGSVHVINNFQQFFFSVGQ